MPKQALNTALSALSARTGRDYTLAYNRTCTLYWALCDGLVVSPRMRPGPLAQWLRTYTS